MNFRLGQKVVCVAAAPNYSIPDIYRYKGPDDLRIGAIYTIRAIDFRAEHLHGVPCVRLDEIQRAEYFSAVGMWESGFAPYRFRPLVESKRKSSIEQFHAIRRDVEQTVKVPFQKVRV